MAKTASQPIWTLDARDNRYLQALTGFFDMSNPQTRGFIQTAHEELLKILRIKRIDYGALRAALIPSTTRLEYAFIFDSAKVESGLYGMDVGDHIAPLLDRRLTCSILNGDLLRLDRDTEMLLLTLYARPDKRAQLSSGVEPYCVYINNLTDSMVQSIITGLDDYEPFIGCIPATFSSPVKDYLSSTLVREYLKTGRTMICAHEDDIPNDKNINNPMWPLDTRGYRVISLQETLFNLFLSYKVERRAWPGESDLKFSLLAISDSPMPLTDLTIDVAEAKLEYLRSAKAGSMELAGLDALTTTQLSELISSKIGHNYIYNLRFLKEHDISLFNIVIEIPVENRAVPVKIMAALEYRPHDRLLRLVTLF
jgi:hypothetical protein